MKRIGIGVMAFVLGYLLLDRGLYALVTPAFRRTDFVYAQVISRQPEVIFFGDSQCRHGIVPPAATAPLQAEGYNLARAGSGMVYTAGVYRAVSAHYRPRLVVVQVMRLASERGAMTSLAPYFDEPGVADLLQYYPLTVRLKYRVSKMLRYNSQLISTTYRLFRPYDELAGYVPLYGVAEGDRTGIGVGSGAAIGAVEQLGRSLLSDLIAAARADGADVVFIEMPTLNALQVDPTGVYREMAAARDIPYLDFNVGGEHDVRFPARYFRDVDHLNDEGARAFSAKLGDALRQTMSRS
jgi:hypothetical protein